MKILFVGHSPESELSPRHQAMEGYDEVLKVHRARTPQFTEFLKSAFDHVEVVYGNDYVESMSDAVDVTIFDAMPPVIEDKDLVTGAWAPDPVTGLDTTFEYKRLSQGFDKPAILIGGASGNMGRPLHLLMDNLCLCLASHALNLNLESDLFKTPNALTPEYEAMETPNVFKSRMVGCDLPDTIDVCRIQTHSFKDGNQFNPGSVATSSGYADAPDAEVFAGGDNAKGVESVALSRQGNYFHWGFDASPVYLTEFGKALFINAVHYIHKFQGQRPQTRRLKGIFARQDIREFFWESSDEGYNIAVTNHANQMNSMREMFIKKQASGKELAPNEQALVDAKESPKPPRMKFLPRFAPELYKTLEQELGDNWNAYLEYYTENEEYFRALGAVKFELDNDMKTLGLSNRKASSLNTLIGMLENNEQTDLAQKLLTRYTALTFSSATQWREWFTQNGDNLYFSETGGYIFAPINRA